MAKRKPRHVVPPHTHQSSSANRGSPLDSLPTSWRAAAWIGIPGAAMAFLLWWTTLGNPDHAVLKAIDSSLSQHVSNERTAIDQMWQLIAAAERTCLNTSKNDLDRIACVSVVRPK